MEKSMKKYIIIFGVIIFIAGIAIIGLSSGETKAIKVSGAFRVHDIQGDPSAYKGTIAINGVVARVSKQDPKIFSIIDTQEAIFCKDVNCASFYLTVKFDGQIPKVWEEVNITGSFAEKGRLFVATKVEVLRNLRF